MEKPLSYLEDHGKISAMMYFALIVMIWGNGYIIVKSVYFNDVNSSLSSLGIWLSIFLFLVVYEVVFGFEKLAWLFINAFFGIFGVTKELDILLSHFGKDFHSFSLKAHAAPMVYYILCTFLIRQATIDFCKARNRIGRERLVDIIFALVSLLFYSYLWLRHE